MQQDTPADNIPKEPELRPLNLYSGDPGYTGSSQVPSVTHTLASEGQPGAAVLLSRLTAANSRSFRREPLGLDAVPGSTEIQVPSQTCKTGNMHTPMKLYHRPPASTDMHGITHLEESCLKSLSPTPSLPWCLALWKGRSTVSGWLWGHLMQPRAALQCQPLSSATGLDSIP